MKRHQWWCGGKDQCACSPMWKEEQGMSEELHAMNEPIPFPTIFMDGQMVNHAALVNEVLGRLYRIEMAQYRIEKALETKKDDRIS